MDADTLTRVAALEQKLAALTGELAQARHDSRTIKVAFDIADLSRRKRKDRMVLFFGRDRSPTMRSICLRMRRSDSPASRRCGARSMPRWYPS
jgi:hypothetical protein